MTIHHELDIHDFDADGIPPACVEVILHKDRLALWGALFHGLIHNVNGPLQNMTMLVDLLQANQVRLDEALLQAPGTPGGVAEEVGEKQRKRLDQLSQQIQILAEMLQDFIALDSIEQNNTEVDLRVLLKRLVRAYRANLFFKHHIVVDLEVSEDLPLFKIPGRALVPSLIHLLDNALAALKDAPEKMLRLRCFRAEDGVHLVFSDSGCGLPPQSLPADWCSPFRCRRSPGYQNPGRRHRHFGLGLYLVCFLLHPFGVRVILSSEGEGTSATLILPTPA